MSEHTGQIVASLYNKQVFTTRSFRGSYILDISHINLISVTSYTLEHIFDITVLCSH